MNDEVKGLDAHIDAALAAVDAPIETDATAVAAETTQDAPAEAVDAPTDGRSRDERGRFAPKTDSPPQTAPDATPDAAIVASADTPADPKPVEPEKAWTDGHFRGWAPEKRAAFEKLPPEAQAVAMDIAKDLQAEFTRKTQETADWKKKVEPVLSTLAKEQDLWADQGLNPLQAFQNYANIERTLKFGNFSDKIGLVQQICDVYGIPFQAPQAADPYQAALHDQNAAVAREKANSEGLKRQLQSFETQEINRTIEQFSSAKNPDGTPAHPHFETVKPAMSALLTSGRAQTLDEAYAIASKPIMDLIEAKAAEARRSVERSQQEAVEKAKRAAPVRSSNNAMPSGKSKASGVDAIISASLDSAGW
jgi:hypothetical protein